MIDFQLFHLIVFFYFVWIFSCFLWEGLPGQVTLPLLLVGNTVCNLFIFGFVWELIWEYSPERIVWNSEETKICIWCLFLAREAYQTNYNCGRQIFRVTNTWVIFSNAYLRFQETSHGEVNSYIRGQSWKFWFEYSICHARIIWLWFILFEDHFSGSFVHWIVVVKTVYIDNSQEDTFVVLQELCKNFGYHSECVNGKKG